MKCLTFLFIFQAVFLTVTKYNLVNGSALYQANWSEDGFCDTKLFTQPVSSDGCKTKFIENGYCYGQCSSTYSYLTNTIININCSACQPELVSKHIVELTCDGGKLKAIEVDKVESCRCIKRVCRVLNTMEPLNEGTVAKRRLQSKSFVSQNFKINQSRKKNKNQRLIARKNRCLKKFGRRKTQCLTRWKKRLSKFEAETY